MASILFDLRKEKKVALSVSDATKNVLICVFFSLPYPSWSLLFLPIPTSILCCILLLALEYVAVLARLGEK